TEQLLATVVFGAGEVEYTGFGEAAQDVEHQDQAELLPPDGDMYQAFVMPHPEVSCAPFGDQLDAGQPAAQSIEYRVEVLGVAESLTREIAAQEPFVTLPEGYDPWYRGVE